MCVFVLSVHFSDLQLQEQNGEVSPVEVLLEEHELDLWDGKQRIVLQIYGWERWSEKEGVHRLSLGEGPDFAGYVGQWKR